MTIALEIEHTNQAIKSALWDKGDIELAQILISKKTGLRICAGELSVRLKRVRV